MKIVLYFEKFKVRWFILNLTHFVNKKIDVRIFFKVCCHRRAGILKQKSTESTITIYIGMACVQKKELDPTNWHWLSRSNMKKIVNFLCSFCLTLDRKIARHSDKKRIFTKQINIISWKNFKHKMYIYYSFFALFIYKMIETIIKYWKYIICKNRKIAMI